MTMKKNFKNNKENQAKSKDNHQELEAKTMGKNHGQKPWAKTMGKNHGQKSWAKIMGHNHGPQSWATIMGKNHGQKSWAKIMGKNRGQKSWAKIVGKNHGQKSWAKNPREEPKHGKNTGKNIGKISGGRNTSGEPKTSGEREQHTTEGWGNTPGKEGGKRANAQKSNTQRACKHPRAPVNLTAPAGNFEQVRFVPLMTFWPFWAPPRSAGFSLCESFFFLGDLPQCQLQF